MKLKISRIVSYTALFCVIGLSLYCGEKPTASKDKGYYTCSMHPEVISQEPGSCPICSMDLTYIEASQDPEHREHIALHKDQAGRPESTHQPLRFSLTPTLLANANLATLPVTKQKFSRKARYSAHIDYNESANRLVLISTKYDGWVEKLLVSKEGQYVRRGQILMGVYSPTILAAKEEYIIVFNAVKSLFEFQSKPLDKLFQDPTLKAARQKLLYLDIPPAQIRKLERTGKTSRQTYYVSPISGVVVKKNILQGTFIRAGEEILRIANLSKLWVIFHIFEKDLSLVKKGQRVVLKTRAYSEQKLVGHVDLIYPFLDPKSKDIKVRAVVNNRKGLLKPGMFAEVEVAQELPKEQIIIPDSAIIYSGDKSYVFVSLGNGSFELRYLQIRFDSQGQVVISKGLQENELIVINGQFLLSSEASLKEALSKFHAGN